MIWPRVELIHGLDSIIHRDPAAFLRDANGQVLHLHGVHVVASRDTRNSGDPTATSSHAA